ncbi:AbfB domain-containing protein [Streptomyces sp. NPDC000618]|uniref:AbfB domain-containing protein n=1 Tax=Streptomyces sp. NPDC000618 TaxID=3154265 RepID=UPI00331D3E93
MTAIALNDKPVDDEKAAAREGQTLSDDETAGGLISFATPSASASSTPTAGKSGTSVSASPKTSASASASSSPKPQGSSTPHTSAAPSASPTKKPADPKPTSIRRSVRSVNYPDRYWHVSNGVVKLDEPRGSESRADSTFTVVAGLTNSSCYSFRTSDGDYLRHRNFVLRAEGNDGSTLFKQDATFCSVPSSSYSDAVMLESVNYPGRFLRHQNFALRLDPYGYNTSNRSDFSFRVVAALG